MAIFDIEDGMVPEIPVTPRSKWANDDRRVKDAGMGPVMDDSNPTIVTRFVRLPMLDGRLPVITVAEKSRLLSLARLPIVDGSEPESRLSPTMRWFSRLSEPIDSGMDPVNRLSYK